MAGRKAKSPENHITAYVTPDLYKFIEGDAAARTCGKSEIIREILTAHYYGAQHKTEKDVFAEVKQMMYRYMKYQLNVVFATLTRELPDDYDDLRQRVGAFERGPTGGSR